MPKKLSVIPLDVLLNLRDAFFTSENVEHQQDAISILRAYQTKGHVPHPVISTGLIISSILSDQNETDPFVARLAYSMAFVKYVFYFKIYIKEHN